MDFTLIALLKPAHQTILPLPRKPADTYLIKPLPMMMEVLLVLPGIVKNTWIL
ncbi:hypothetical protein KRR40_40675 [Niabella defluvii]|nr:hypothetical protein KRR40_40675 [Niabella sp. I65]